MIYFTTPDHKRQNAGLNPIENLQVDLKMISITNNMHLLNAD